MRDEDERIQQGIAELTKRRSRQAPDFETLLSRRESPKQHRGYMLGWIAAAALIVFGLSLWLMVPNVEDPQGEMLAQLEAVGDLSAATDVFLPTGNPRWMSETPPLGQADLTIYTGLEP
jgi:hypothetical protein